MSIQDINKAIQDPAFIAHLSKDEVMSLLHKYPYCASLHLLSTKILHIENNPDYQAQLAHTAAYANDRKALFRLIYESGSIKDSGGSISSKEFSENFADEFSSLININTETDISDKVLEAQSEYAHEEKVEISKSEQNSLEELEAHHVQHVLDDLSAELNLLSESGSGEMDMHQQSIDEENEDEFVDEHLDPEMESNTNLIHEVGEQKLNEVLKSSELESFSASMASVEEIEDNNPLHYSQEPVSESSSALKIEETIEQLQDDSLRANNEKLEVVEILPENNIDNGKKSFTDWLKKFSTENSSRLLAPPSKTTEAQNASQQELITSTVQIISEEQTDEDLNALSNQYHEEQATVYFKETEEDLNRIIKEEIKTIDEFVQNQPESKRYNGELKVSVAELAKRSLDDSQEIITETMARVLAAQGKFKKAIDILEKLVLLHPEKRLYFAALIEEFKKQNF